MLSFTITNHIKPSVHAGSGEISRLDSGKTDDAWKSSFQDFWSIFGRHKVTNKTERIFRAGQWAKNA
ncbi:MAG TPA: hypothetical protein DEB10_07540 [Ruminococcaceae bacterium]|nr:hypothetical protein [Oscillospiraceae bacterium]